jgi:hypothetical protein
MGKAEAPHLLNPVSLSISVTLALTVAQAGQLALPGSGTAPAAESADRGADPSAEGRYAGLSLDPQARNPLPAPKDDPPRLMWTGFSPGAAGGEIFLQTTRQVAHDMSVTSGAGGRPTLSVFLRNCRIHWKNNARRIDTSFFATPVDGIVAKQKRKDVELSIRLKESVVPEVRTAPGPDGSQLLVLSFPAGASAAPAAEGHGLPAPASAPALAPTSPAQLAPPPTGAPLSPPPVGTR